MGKGCPKKKQAKSAKKPVREDPGPLRPTTAKRREGRPSSAERNRDEQVKPSVWLENMSRDSKAGTRSFINCDPAPQSAGKVKKKKSRTNNNNQERPSSAEGK